MPQRSTVLNTATFMKHRKQKMSLTTKNMKFLVGPHIDTTIWGKDTVF